MKKILRRVGTIAMILAWLCGVFASGVIVVCMLVQLSGHLNSCPICGWRTSGLVAILMGAFFFGGFMPYLAMAFWQDITDSLSKIWNMDK